MDILNSAATVIGYITAALIALLALLEALNKVIKKLPITANNVKELFKKGGLAYKRKTRLP